MLNVVFKPNLKKTVNLLKKISNKTTYKKIILKKLKVLVNCIFLINKFYIRTIWKNLKSFNQIKSLILF